MLHKLNAEEPDAARRVSVNAPLVELHEIAARGFIVQPAAPDCEAGTIAMLLAPHGGEERLVLSIVARRETIEARCEDFIAELRRGRQRLASGCAPSPRLICGGAAAAKRAARAGLRLPA